MPSMMPVIMDSHGNPGMAGDVMALDVLDGDGLVTIADAKVLLLDELTAIMEEGVELDVIVAGRGFLMSATSYWYVPCAMLS